MYSQHKLIFSISKRYIYIYINKNICSCAHSLTQLTHIVIKLLSYYDTHLPYSLTWFIHLMYTQQIRVLITMSLLLATPKSVQLHSCNYGCMQIRIWEKSIYFLFFHIRLINLSQSHSQLSLIGLCTTRLSCYLAHHWVSTGTTFQVTLVVSILQPDLHMYMLTMLLSGFIFSP